MNTQTKQSDLKTLVRGAYDLQKLRIQMGNRIVGNFKVKLGQVPGEKEEDTLDAEGAKILDNLRRDYKKITDGMKDIPPQSRFKAEGVISTYAELVLLDQYVKLESSEARNFRQLEGVLREFPIYVSFLKGVTGVGPAMAGVILSEIDIHKAQYPSSLWAYAGLDVAGNGAGRSKKKEHLVEVEYINKEGEKATRVGITFNPFLKTKLVGVLASSFLKQSPAKCEYRLIYDNYKHRLESHPDHVEKTKGHRHNMAMRYTIKRFLVDLYKEWRTLEGLAVAPEYSEGKLGKIHKLAA